MSGRRPYCSTGQNPQGAVARMEEEGEEQEVGEGEEGEVAVRGGEEEEEEEEEEDGGGEGGGGEKEEEEEEYRTEQHSPFL